MGGVRNRFNLFAIERLQIKAPTWQSQSLSLGRPSPCKLRLPRRPMSYYPRCKENTHPFSYYAKLIHTCAVRRSAVKRHRIITDAPAFKRFLHLRAPVLPLIASQARKRYCLINLHFSSTGYTVGYFWNVTALDLCISKQKKPH